jgi:hypothetical protein
MLPKQLSFVFFKGEKNFRDPIVFEMASLRERPSLQGCCSPLRRDELIRVQSMINKMG